jgi:hypothetical protein
MMNDLDPDQRLKALKKLKTFVDAEYERVNREYAEAEKAVKAASIMQAEPKSAV